MVRTTLCALLGGYCALGAAGASSVVLDGESVLVDDDAVALLQGRVSNSKQLEQTTWAAASGLAEVMKLSGTEGRAALSSTALHSLKELWSLPKKLADDFLDSYELFHHNHVNGSAKETKQIGDYYRVLNHLCALGDVEKMYIPPAINTSLGVGDNQRLWEEQMADHLQVGPGKTILDIGCGRGRVAQHVAEHTGANVVGMNLDQDQIKNAKDNAQKLGMESRLDFKHANLNERLPFKNETFDGMYEIQAFTYADDLDRMLSEVNRVLKPGARVCFLDWVKLDAYNASIKHHRHLLIRTKEVIGAVATPSPEHFEHALIRNGFEVLLSKDASPGLHQWPMIAQASASFMPYWTAINGLDESSKLMPPHLKNISQRFVKGGASFVEADQLGLFTTSYSLVARKKLASESV